MEGGYYIITTRGKQHDPENKGGSVFGMDTTPLNIITAMKTLT